MSLRQIPPEQAAQALQGLEALDPRGLMQAADLLAMCRNSRCLQLDTEGGNAVVVVTERNGVVWVNAAAGSAPACLTSAITQALSESGARSIAFQTARPGLVRKAERLGYRVTGYIMRRDE